MRSLVITLLSGAAALSLTACDVEQTEEGDLPEVNVEGGNLPEFDVDTADVEVQTEEKTIEVPTLDVEEPDAGAAGR